MAAIAERRLQTKEQRPGSQESSITVFFAHGYKKETAGSQTPGAERLLAFPVPDIPQKQLDWYKPENLQFRPAGSFNPAEMVNLLKSSKGTKVGTVDMGADKIVADIREVTEDGTFKTVVKKEPKKSKKGDGYVEYMEEAASMFRQNGVESVGTSFAGPIDGTKPIEATNIHTLQEKLDKKYDGDLANIFKGIDTVAGDNDAVAGLVAAIVEAYRKNPNLKRVIYLIHGGGFGGAIWEKGKIIAAEPGHVPVIDEMNPFKRDEACGQKTSKTKDKTCVEKVGASGEGVEKTYVQVTGEKRSGIEIGKIHENVNGEYSEEESETATKIYDAAARIVAMGAVGMDSALGPQKDGDKPLDPTTTTVIIHGGLTKTPGVPERVGQILKAHLEKQGHKHTPNILYTKDFSDNACSDGAATLALAAKSA